MDPVGLDRLLQPSIDRADERSMLERESRAAQARSGHQAARPLARVLGDDDGAAKQFPCQHGNPTHAVDVRVDHVDRRAFALQPRGDPKRREDPRSPDRGGPVGDADDAELAVPLLRE
jgi:hypothetical protein